MFFGACLVAPGYVGFTKSKMGRPLEPIARGRFFMPTAPRLLSGSPVMQPAKLLNQIVEGSLLEDRARSLTRQEFCAIERMSLTTYAKLQKAGLGPDEVRFPGLSFVRITS